MWDLFIKDVNTKVIVVSDQIDVTKDIREALYVDWGLYTIILDSERPKYNNMKIEDLQVISEVGEAVAYRNVNDKNVKGWVLFVSKENERLDSLTSVAHVIYQPHLVLLKGKLDTIDISVRNAKQVLELLSKRDISDQSFWMAMRTENKYEFFQVFGLVYKDNVDLKKYNDDYQEIINAVLKDQNSRENVIETLDEVDGKKFREFIEYLDRKVIEEYNFIEEYSASLNEPENHSLLEKLDLPEKSPVKIDVKVSFKGKGYLRINANNYFVDPNTAIPVIQVNNTSGFLRTNNTGQSDIPFAIGECLELEVNDESNRLVVSAFSNNGKGHELKFGFYPINRSCIGLYTLVGNSLKELKVNDDNEIEFEGFSQSSVLYIIHYASDNIACSEAILENTLVHYDVQLTKVSAFNTEDTSIELYIGNDCITLLNFSFGSKKIVLVSDTLKKKRAMSLSYGSSVFSLKENNVLFDLEKSFLEYDLVNMVISGASSEFIHSDNLMYSCDLDTFDVSEYNTSLESQELSKSWEAIKQVLVSQDYSSTNVLNILLDLDGDLVKDFYDAYTRAIELDLENTSRFLTISVLEDSNLHSVILPLFHPIVLFDLFKYFQNYSRNEAVSFNAYNHEVAIRSLWFDSKQMVYLDNTGVSQPIFVHENSDLNLIIDFFDLNRATSRFMSYRPLDEDQISKSLMAMFDYVGYSRVFNIRLKIDHKTELRSIISLLKNEQRVTPLILTSRIVLFVDDYLFDSLEGYYTDGNKNILIARVNGNVTFDLLIDARKKEKIKYRYRVQREEYIPSLIGVGMNTFSYENYTGLSYCVIYPENLKAHRLISAPVNKFFEVSVRSNESEVLDLNQSRIISLQIERFNAIKTSLEHIVYETQTANRLRYSSNLKSNFIIAIRGTRQLETRLTFSLSQYSLGDHVKLLEAGLLSENLFSFSHMFGNRNKMKGIVGELLVFKAFHEFLLDELHSINGFLIPVDLIISELKIYFKAHSPFIWSKYPDFMLIRFDGSECFISTVEVKSRLVIDPIEVYEEQILPFENVLNHWLGEMCDSKISQKRFVVFLIEYLIHVKLDSLSKRNLNAFYNWISMDDAVLKVDTSIMVQLSDDGERVSEVKEGYKLVKEDFANSLEAYLRQHDVNVLAETLSKIISEHKRGSEERRFEVISDSDMTKNVVADVIIDQGIYSSISEIDEIPANEISSIDLTEGREELLLELENIYQEVRTKLIRNNVSIKSLPSGVKVSPMNVRFTYLPSEGSSIKRVQSKAADIAIWLKLPQSQKVDIDSDKGMIIMQFALARDQRMMFRYSSINSLTTGKSGLSVPIGVDVDGEIVEFSFGSDSPHLLIGGTTGAGKSVALETIIGGLLLRYNSDYLNLLYIDPKRVELIGFEDCLAVKENCLGLKPGFDAIDAIDILSSAVTEMERRNKLFLTRYRQLKDAGEIRRGQSVRSIDDYNQYTPDSILPRLLIVLDEYADLVSDKDDKKLIQEELVRIAQKGRSTGIHLIVATQKPVVEVIDTVVKSNLPASLALKVKNSTDSGVILGEAGAEGLLGQGDAYLKVGGDKTRLQVARFDLFDKIK